MGGIRVLQRPIGRYRPATLERPPGGRGGMFGRGPRGGWNGRFLQAHACGTKERRAGGGVGCARGRVEGQTGGGGGGQAVAKHGISHYKYELRFLARGLQRWSSIDLVGISLKIGCI